MHFFPSPRTRTAIDELFINYKQLLEVGPAGRTGMFSFQTDAVRGFQIGNPTQSRLVRSTLFPTRTERSLSAFVKIMVRRANLLRRRSIGFSGPLRPVAPDAASSHKRGFPETDPRPSDAFTCRTRRQKVVYLLMTPDFLALGLIWYIVFLFLDHVP